MPPFSEKLSKSNAEILFSLTRHNISALLLRMDDHVFHYHIGSVITRLRIDAGLSQKALATQIGMRPQNLNAIERRGATISLTAFLRILAALHVRSLDVQELLPPADTSPDPADSSSLAFAFFENQEEVTP